MAKLSVNVDHVATVRQARRAKNPDPVTAALIAEMAGAEGITVHLREDRRHIQDRDLRLLRQTIKTRLNLEMAATKEMISIASEIKPDSVTLVPERREELTTEGGLDVISHYELVKRAVDSLKKADISVGAFVDPNPLQIKEAKRVGCDYIEVHTGNYCDAISKQDMEGEYGKILLAVEEAFKLGLSIRAGHGLDYNNVGRIAAIEKIEELSIGYSIVARAIFVGFERAVKEMVALLKG